MNCNDHFFSSVVTWKSARSKWKRVVYRKTQDKLLRKSIGLYVMRPAFKTVKMKSSNTVYTRDKRMLSVERERQKF